MGIPDVPHVPVGGVGSCATECLASASRIGTGDVLALAVIPSWEHLEDARKRQVAVAEAMASLTHCYEEATAHLTVPAGQRLSLEFLPGDDEAEALLARALGHHYDLVVLSVHGNESELHRKIGHVANRVMKAAAAPSCSFPNRTRPSTGRPHTSVRAKCCGTCSAPTTRSTADHSMEGDIHAAR